MRPDNIAPPVAGEVGTGAGEAYVRYLTCKVVEAEVDCRRGIDKTDYGNHLVEGVVTSDQRRAGADLDTGPDLNEAIPVRRMLSPPPKFLLKQPRSESLMWL